MSRHQGCGGVAKAVRRGVLALAAAIAPVAALGERDEPDARTTVSLNADGTTNSTVTTTRRNGELVLSTTVDRSGKAVRLYYLRGRYVFSERDDDGDGFFELVVIEGTSTPDLEIFRRFKSGEVAPVSASERQSAMQDRLRKVNALQPSLLQGIVGGDEPKDRVPHNEPTVPPSPASQ